MVLGAVLGLGACAPQAPGSGFMGLPTTGAFGGPSLAPEAPRTRTALLAPLSGPNAPLGQALLNAATLAVFEAGPGAGVELAPHDTGGTGSGAAAAARSAVGGGSRVVLGPLTSAETTSAAAPARAAGVPMLAFTNDQSRAGSGVWVLGLTPEQQVRRVVATAVARGDARRLALAAQNNDFGRAMAAALRGAASDLGLQAPVVALYPAGADLGMAAGDLLQRSGGAPPDALLMGETGERAVRFVTALQAALPPDTPPPRLLGHALWAQDPAVLRGEPTLAGALFAAPDPLARARFEQRYRDAFGEAPPRVAGVAYDAARAAIGAMRGGPAASPQLGTGEVVDGADGALRLMPDGRTLRGLAVFAVNPVGEPTLVESATVPVGQGS